MTMQDTTQPFIPREAVYPLFIGGTERAGEGEASFSVTNPSTGRKLAEFSSASESDIDLAVAAALDSFHRGWGRLMPKERSKLMNRFAAEIRRRVSDFAFAETLDVGRPIALTSGEMEGLAESVEFYAGTLLALSGETLNVSDPTLADFTLREPLGVCGLITPWNYPGLLAILKIAPALAAGNTVVLKPSEVTPLSAALLAECAQAADLPAGTINIVYGGAVPGMRLVRHPGVAKISFTGSTLTGKRIFVEAAQTMKKLTLELGGKSPLVVFDDADIDAAVDAAFTDNVRNSGQVCAACTRLIIQDGIHDDFVKRLEERLRSVAIGIAERPETRMGPVVSDTQRTTIEECVDTAAREGATVRRYSDLTDRDDLRAGYFVAPTLLLDARSDMKMSRAEIFGPVQSVFRFRDEGQAVELANDSEFGLAAAVFTQDAARAMRSARAISAGTVCINTGRKVSVDAPFGGFRQSGFGKERGVEAMLEDTQLKNVRYSLS